MLAWSRKASSPAATRNQTSTGSPIPTGIAWETFHTLGGIPVYGEDTPVFNHGASAVPVESPGGPMLRSGAEGSSLRRVAAPK